MKSARAKKAKQIKRSLKLAGLSGADLQRAFEAKMGVVREARQRRQRRIERIFGHKRELQITGRDRQAEAASLRRLEFFDLDKIGRLMATEDTRECPICSAQFVTTRGDSETNCWGCR